MTSDPKRIERLIAAALPLGAAARASLLDEACGDDTSLRTWVEALIRAREQAATWSPPENVPHSAGGSNGQPSANGDAETSHAPSDAASPPPSLRVHGGQSAAPTSGNLDFPFLESPTRPDAIGRLGPYAVLEVLGQGTCGVVFKAFDARAQRLVALKVLSPNLAASATARRYFLEEARAAAAIAHENVVGIYAVQEQPIPYAAMEYVVGPSLGDKLAHGGPLELKQILRIGQQIAAGLAAAHQQGLLHGSLKPSNVLLVGGLERVKITDFGSAGVAGDLGVAADAPQCMAPEQVMGDELDERTDLFSLGTLLYMLCTGRPPFGETGSPTIVKQVVERQPREIREINRDIPPWLCKIIGKLHGKMPADRYQTAAEVSQLLANCLADLQRRGEVAGPRERAAAVAPPRRRWRATAAVLFQVLIFAGSLAAFYYDLPPFGPPDAENAPHQQQAPEVGTLSIQVQQPGLRLTLKRLGEHPHTLAEGTEAKTQSLTLPPGRYWVGATRGDAKLESKNGPAKAPLVFEQFVDLGAGDTKSVTIHPRAP